jgi:hypothetical protein
VLYYSAAPSSFMYMNSTASVHGQNAVLRADSGHVEYPA